VERWTGLTALLYHGDRESRAVMRQHAWRCSEPGPPTSGRRPPKRLSGLLRRCGKCDECARTAACGECRGCSRLAGGEQARAAEAELLTGPAPQPGQAAPPRSEEAAHGAGSDPTPEDGPAARRARCELCRCACSSDLATIRRQEWVTAQQHSPPHQPDDDSPLSRRSSAVWGGAGAASSREAAPPPALPGEVSGDESSESEVEAEVERPTLFDLADLAAAAVPAASEGGAPPQLTLPPPPPPHAAMLSSAAAVPVGVHVAVPVRGTHSAPVLAGLQGGGGEALVRRKKKMRCGECEACVAPNCGECRFCLDMPKFGGVGTLRQPCLQRRCTKAHPASVAAASSSAPRSVTVLPSVPPALLGAPPVVARPVRAAGESSSPPATNEAAFLSRRDGRARDQPR